LNTHINIQYTEYITTAVQSLNYIRELLGSYLIRLSYTCWWLSLVIFRLIQQLYLQIVNGYAISTLLPINIFRLWKAGLICRGKGKVVPVLN